MADELDLYSVPLDPEAAQPDPEADDEDVNINGWPAPEVRARTAAPDEVPSTCKGLAKLAETQGWLVRVTYARGTIPEAKNRWRPGRVVDSVLLRAYRSGVAVSASWESKPDGTLKSAASWLKLPGHCAIRITIPDVRSILAVPLEER